MSYTTAPTSRETQTTQTRHHNGQLQRPHSHHPVRPPGEDWKQHHRGPEARVRRYDSLILTTPHICRDSSTPLPQSSSSSAPSPAASPRSRCSCAAKYQQREPASLAHAPSRPHAAPSSWFSAAATTIPLSRCTTPSRPSLRRLERLQQVWCGCGRTRRSCQGLLRRPSKNRRWCKW